ncbi:uncharacterized protein K02A2.6 [Trichonephila clavipes]|nr:uncharacterized protein K02A2.6 [Trichonephila clavipes]
MSQIEALPVTLRSYDGRRVKILSWVHSWRALWEGKDLQGGKPSITLRMAVLCTDKGSVFQGNFGRTFWKNYMLDTLRNSKKMKAIARSFVYWKNIDNDIEEAAKNCVDCARYKADPPKSKVHYWEYPSMPWNIFM